MQNNFDRVTTLKVCLLTFDVAGIFVNIIFNVVGKIFENIIFDVAGIFENYFRSRVGLYKKI